MWVIFGVNTATPLLVWALHDLLDILVLGMVDLELLGAYSPSFSARTTSAIFSVFSAFLRRWPSFLLSACLRPFLSVLDLVRLVLLQLRPELLDLGRNRGGRLHLHPLQPTSPQQLHLDAGV